MERLLRSSELIEGERGIGPESRWRRDRFAPDHLTQLVLRATHSDTDLRGFGIATKRRREPEALSWLDGPGFHPVPAPSHALVVGPLAARKALARVGGT